MPDKEELSRIPLFSKLNEEEIRRCIDSSDELFLQSGEEFITEGKTADYFYVLLSETVQVTKKVSDKNEASLDTLGVGKYMGKVLLLLLFIAISFLYNVFSSQLFLIFSSQMNSTVFIY